MKSPLRITASLATALLALALAPMVSGQVLGTIQGQVTDESGAPLAGATVVISSQTTGYARTVIADDEGRYRAPSLPNDFYTVTMTMEGLGSAQRRNQQLLVGQILDIDLRQGVDPSAEGVEVSETITITSESPLIEVSRSSTASYISENEIRALPIVGRDFKQFALLAPTVTSDPSRGFIRMSGQRGIYSGLRLDGTSGKNAFFGYGNGGEATENDGLVVAQESVQEFQVIQNGFSPEYGLDGGGFVNVVTKSGSNDFHGSVFYYFTDDSLSADLPASPLDKVQGRPNSTAPDEFERENWGITAGGPIQRDKAHFFVAYDQTTRLSPIERSISNPGLYDAVLQRAITDPNLGILVEGFTPNNDGIAAPDQVLGRTASGLFQRDVDNLILFGKVNWFVDDQNSVALRYNYTDYERLSSYIYEESLKQEATDSIVGSVVSVIGTRSVNDFRFQYGTDDLNRGNVLVGTPVQAEFAMRFGNFNSIGKQDFLPIVANTKQFQLKDSFSYLFGNHDLKFGVDYSADNMQQIFAGSKDGEYRYNSLDAFLRNEADAVRIYFGNVTFPNYDETQDVYGLFAQDSWKSGSGNLTLNYGLRYGKTDNPSGLEHVFEVGREIPDDEHVAPRFGFTYQPGGDGRQVIRGGFGVFYGRTPTLLFASQIQENGLFPNFGRVVVGPGDAAFINYPNPIPNENPPQDTIPSTSYFDPDFRDAKSTRINLGYERELARNWSAAVDAIYSEGKNLQRNYNDNSVVVGHDEFGRPDYGGVFVDPNFNNIFVRRSNGESEYTAVTLKVNRRFSGRYSFQAHYTYTDDKDTDSNEREATAVTVSDSSNPRYDWGTSFREVENRFVALGVVDLPAGFRVSGSYNYESGLPWTAIDPDGTGHNCPLDCPDQRGIINGQLVPRNSFRNESIKNLNLRGSWLKRLGDGKEVEIFLEGFNVLDDNSFAVNNAFDLTLEETEPSQRVGNSAFGIPDNRVTRPRLYQIGAKFRM